MFLFISLLLLSPLPSSALDGTHSHQHRKGYLRGQHPAFDPIAPLLLAFFTCSASSELPSSASLDPLTEGADAHLPVPRSLDGVLSTSWFRGHEAQAEAMSSSPEGLPGPGHTGRETPRLRTRKPSLLPCFIENTQGILRSELNYSAILQWVASIEPEPALRWTFNGHPRGIGERLIIQRLSLEDLGIYVCLAENSQGMYFSQPVTIMLPREYPTVTLDPVPLLVSPAGLKLWLLYPPLGHHLPKR
uniref:Ig-like domain-containing protein n=1 Tax=Balaenoptera musculus TaxID=9771 RepID=A0A8C0DQG4_BALMU